MYKIEKLEAKKAILVTTEGFFKEEEVEAYKKDFQKVISSINPSQYIFVADGRKQKVSSQNLMDELQGVINAYTSIGFKKVYITHFESKIADMQVKRLKNIEKVTFINDPNEVL